MSNNGRTCSVLDDGNIFQDLSAFDVPVTNVINRKTPGSKTFDIAFLADVIEALKLDCFTFHSQCKSQYPIVGPETWSTLITSLDQENRMSLAHVLEQSGVPTLFNTPRLCDPGMLVSKNWSLRNYIETRLVDFKYTYNLGTTVKTRDPSECYPRIVLDFRPFEFKIRLPNPKVNAQDDIMYVTEWITVEDKVQKDIGYSPHIALSKTSLGKSINTRTIFKQMIARAMDTIIETKLTNKRNVSEKNSGMQRDAYIENFIKFLEKIDQLYIVDGDSKFTNTTVPELNFSDEVLAIIYYDMLHDKLFSKSHLPFAKSIKQGDMKGATSAEKATQFQKIPSVFRKKNRETFNFRAKFKDEFKKLVGSVQYDGLVGKGIVQTSVTNYGPWLILKPKNGVIPAFLKTLGDLSQYVYAAKYQTVVATGDRMGVGAGLYINAKSNKKVKCMIEDSTTGFVIYSGFTNLKFRRRSACNVKVNGTQACSLNTVVNKRTIANRLRQAAPDQELLKKMIRNKPKIPSGLKGLPNQWIRSANAVNNATANTIANSIIKFKEYWGEDEANKLINAYGKLQKRITNTNKRAAIETIINGVLPENQKIRVNRTTGRINKVSSPSRNATPNGTATPNGNARVNATPNGNRKPNTTPNGIRKPNATPNGNGMNVNNTTRPNATPNGTIRANATPSGNGMNVNNTIKRINNLNAYLNNLQRNLGNKGKLNKSIYLNKLRQTNSNKMLTNMKVRAKANAAKAKANADRNSRVTKRQRTASN